RAFGSDPDCLGIILVTDLPKEYPFLRERLLRLAYKFAQLGEATREKYSDPSSRYSFGWSHGKEIMNGSPADLLKGSYYANISVSEDLPSVSSELCESYKEYYGANVWPSNDEKGIEGFEQAFKALGSFVFKVGCELAAACQPFVSAHMRDVSISLQDMISTSRTTKARLLHYFPSSPSPSVSLTDEDDEPIDSWCGFHKDHSLLTGLCSAMYLSLPRTASPEVEPTIGAPPSPSSGLYIRTRGGSLRRVAIPANALAFQTGEALELATEGRLRATPHCVRVGRGGGNPANVVSRETFALFMQPDTHQAISASETFGDFSKRIFEEHYEEM
ncbi:hypothetical protein BS47DRAFT_1289640, partial [Hydnum rufescens UP504]